MKRILFTAMLLAFNLPAAYAQFDLDFGDVGSRRYYDNDDRRYFEDDDVEYRLEKRGRQVFIEDEEDGEFSIGSQDDRGRFVSDCNQYVCVEDSVIYLGKRRTVRAVNGSKIRISGVDSSVNMSQVAITHGSSGKYSVGDQVITMSGNKATVVGVYTNKDLALKAQGEYFRRTKNDIKSVASASEQSFVPEESVGTSFGNERVNKVHIDVRNIAVTGECPGYDQCFRMFVYLNNRLAVTWKTSPGKVHLTARGEEGEFTPEWTNARPSDLGGGKYRLEGPDYVSKSYPKLADGSQGGAPMPWAIFFNGTGIAIHGSDAEVNGEQMSHGCMRLIPDNARQLQEWVREAGGANTTLTVRDTLRSY